MVEYYFTINLVPYPFRSTFNLFLHNCTPIIFFTKKKQLYFPDNLIHLRPFMIINLSIRSFAVLIPNYNPTQSISFRKTFKIPSIKNNNESIREKKKDIVKKFHLFRYRGRCHLRKFFSASTDCVATVFPSNLQRKRRLVEMPPRPPPRPPPPLDIPVAYVANEIPTRDGKNFQPARETS